MLSIFAGETKEIHKNPHDTDNSPEFQTGYLLNVSPYGFSYIVL
jgi:hypothetical protein